MPHPPIQIVNDSDQPIGEASIDETYDKGLLHRVVYIILEDPSGRLLLQKRSPQVVNYPNRWDISSAGHVDAGESYEEAASRELLEEAGLESDGLDIKEIDYFRSDEKHAGGILKHRFNKIYKAVIPADTSFKPQPEEVTGFKWFDIKAAKKLIAESPDDVATGLVLCVDRYY